MLAHQAAGVIKAGLQGRPPGRGRLGRGRAQRVAQGHGHVTQPALMANAPDRAALGQAQKVGLAPVQQRHQLLTDQALAFVKIRQGTTLGVAVPGAHQLAIVAAVDAIAHQRAQVQRDGARVLYGQVRDAAPGVKPVRRHDGLSRANVDAGAATAAMGRHGLAGRQCQVHINLAQEKHGAGLAVEQQGVFAAPALAAARCQLGLQHRR